VIPRHPLLICAFMLGLLVRPEALLAESASSVFFDEALKTGAEPRQLRSTPPMRQAVLPWRTIVIPAPLDPTPAAPGLAPRAAAPFQAARPLTGYAHELGGIASYYWQDQMTSSGERFDRHAHTAAHKTLPLGTRVRVTNLSNGKSTIVRINDRGPFKPGRVIDLSEAAAGDLAMKDLGLVRVAIEVVQ
jgi:rare lipoprotein A (peptidoglycan hydrolase)